MGNSGSSIGDIFYPDNPKRRQRCLELSSAINMYIAEFEQLKAQRLVCTHPGKPVSKLTASTATISLSEFAPNLTNYLRIKDLTLQQN